MMTNLILQRINSFFAKQQKKCKLEEHSHPGMYDCHPVKQKHHKGSLAAQWHGDNSTAVEQAYTGMGAHAYSKSSQELLKFNGFSSAEKYLTDLGFSKKEAYNLWFNMPSGEADEYIQNFLSSKGKQQAASSKTLDADSESAKSIGGKKTYTEKDKFDFKQKEYEYLTPGQQQMVFDFMYAQKKSGNGASKNITAKYFNMPFVHGEDLDEVYGKVMNKLDEENFTFHLKVSQENKIAPWETSVGETEQAQSAKKFLDLSPEKQQEIQDFVTDELNKNGANVDAALAAASDEFGVVFGSKENPATKIISEKTKAQLEEAQKSFDIGEEADLELLEGKKGSTEGGLYKNKTSGKKMYIKFPGKDRAEVETLANKLYKLAGINVANIGVATFQGKDAVASEWLEGAKPMTAEEMAARPEVVKNFAIDAWLGNWDAVGADFDNIVLGKDGKAYRIDPGGSLYYRAQGSKKDFGDTVPELESMLSSSTAPQASKVFNKSGKALQELKSLFSEGANKLSAITDKQIDDIVSSSNIEHDKTQLAATLKTRRDNIVNEILYAKEPVKLAEPKVPELVPSPKAKPVESFILKNENVKHTFEKYKKLAEGVDFDDKASVDDFIMKANKEILGEKASEDSYGHGKLYHWQGGGPNNQVETRAAIAYLKGNSEEQKVIDAGYFLYEKKLSPTQFEKLHNGGTETALSLIPHIISSQEFLKKKYPKGYVTVYRGLGGNIAQQIRSSYKYSKSDTDKFPMPHKGCSGFSFKLSTAESFGSDGVVFKKKIPIESIWVYFNAFNNNYKGEEEIIVDPDAVDTFMKHEVMLPGITPITKSAERWESIYDLIDNHLMKMSPHIFQSKTVLPKGAKTLGENIESNIYGSFRNSVNDWFYKLSGEDSADEAIISLKKNMLQWQTDISKETLEDAQELFSKGLAAGAKEAGIEVDEAFIGEANYQFLKSTGMGPAIENFQNDSFDHMSGIIRKHWENKPGGTYRLKRSLDSYLSKCRFKTRRMAKTETARFSQTGMMKAWEQAEDKHFYSYFWNTVSDKRQKEISKLRNQGNPYNFDTIEFLWNHQSEKLPSGQEQSDLYNQRCWISKGDRLEKEWRGNRFFGQEERFRRTA